MKILFVCSGNNKFKIPPIIGNQAESLTKRGLVIEYYTIEGKGAKGYLKNVSRLKKQIMRGEYDLVHAHYAMAGVVLSLTNSKVRKVVSIMGSEAYMGKVWKFIFRLAYLFSWNAVIAKSDNIKKNLKMDSAVVIPNGVDLERFAATVKSDARNFLGLLPDKKYLLFISNPERPEKNFTLAHNAVQLLNDENVILLPVHGIPNNEITMYLSAGDVLVLPSLWEGSPNVVKEGMACNIPIVSTNVGDVRWLLDGLDGCYVTGFGADEFAAGLKSALNFSNKSGKTKGREKIFELQLDAESVAERLIRLYEKVLGS